MRRKYYVWLAAISILVSLWGCGMFTPFGKGKKAFRQGNYGEAVEEFKKAIIIEEGSDAYQSHVYLGRIYAIRKDYTKAITECKKAFDMYPGSPDACVFLIIIYQLDGQMGKAEKMWDKVSGLPGQGKGFVLAQILPPPRRGPLRPHKVASYVDMLKGKPSK